MIQIETIETSSLGDRSYLAHDGEVAVVVDPQRDIDRVLALAAERGVRITHVLETHVHNDYVSGGLELAGRTGATLPAAGRQRGGVRPHRRRGRRRGRGGADAGAGAAHPRAHPPPRQLRPQPTPPGEVQAVFTGGSMLYGATGRTDLVGPESTPWS